MAGAHEKAHLCVTNNLVLAEDLHGKELLCVLELHEVDATLGSHAQQGEHPIGVGAQLADDALEVPLRMVPLAVAPLFLLEELQLRFLALHLFLSAHVDRWL